MAGEAWRPSRHPDSRCCRRLDVGGVSLRARDADSVTVPLDDATWEVCAWPASMTWSRARVRGQMLTTLVPHADLDVTVARSVAALSVGCAADVVAEAAL